MSATDVLAKQLAEHHATAVSDELRETAGGHLSHDELARQVRMLLRGDYNHEAVCLMGRDRIVWLARKLDELIAAAKTVQFDVYELTTPELRAAFEGKARIAVIQIDTVKALRDAIRSTGAQP